MKNTNKPYKEEEGVWILRSSISHISIMIEVCKPYIYFDKNFRLTIRAKPEKLRTLQHSTRFERISYDTFKKLKNEKPKR